MVWPWCLRGIKHEGIKDIIMMIIIIMIMMMMMMIIIIK